MRKLIGMVLLALLLASAVSTFAVAAPNPYAFFEDEDKAQAAFIAAKSAASSVHMSEAAKAERRMAYQKAYHEAEEDPVALNALAVKMKLVIYRPGGIGILSGSECLNTITAPTKTYDSITGETYFSGTFR